MPAFLFLLLRVRNVRHHKGAACLAQSHNSSSPRACDSSRGWRCYRSCSTKARTETVCYRKRCGTEFTGGFVTKGFRHICPFVCTATPPPLLYRSLSRSLFLSPYRTLPQTHLQAAEAGMVKGDQLLLFGSITADNFGGMAGVATVVQHSIGKTIRVLVKRGAKLKLFPLVPHKWSGGGLLGCQIVPL